MQRFLIITTNCILLFFLLIGLPAATRERLGNVQLSSASTSERLMFLGLGLAAAANILSALIFVKGRKSKILCGEWAAIFCVLLLAYFAFTRGYFNFNWLTRALEWLHNHS